MGVGGNGGWGGERGSKVCILNRLTCSRRSCPCGSPTASALPTLSIPLAAAADGDLPHLAAVLSDCRPMAEGGNPWTWLEVRKTSFGILSSAIISGERADTASARVGGVAA